MSASNANYTAAPRQVTCETSDGDQIPVDLDELRLSHTFKKMYDDLGLEEHDAFPGVFPVRTVNSRIFNKVIEWCKEHKDEPEPVVEKDPLTQECQWFTFSDSERRFFDVWVLEMLELVMAANYLDIPRLYHYACQAVAARIKDKGPREICEMLQQHCDLGRAQIRQTFDDNPRLESTGEFSGVRIDNAIFIPNEVLVTIFEKLPREDLERLQLVSTQFNDVIVNSSELSELQGPLRVVTDVEFGTSSSGLVSRNIHVWLRDGTELTCPDYEDLAKRLKCAVVQNLRLGGLHQGVLYADLVDLFALLPVKSVWKNATVEAFVQCFSSQAQFEVVFTRLFRCKEIILAESQPFGASQPFISSPAFMRLSAIAACSRLDISGLSGAEIQPADVVEWLEHETPPDEKCSEPRQIILDEAQVNGRINGLLTALKTAFSESISPNPYIVQINGLFHGRNLNAVLANEKTHEQLSIRIERSVYVVVERE
ncbi:S-phase kinase-associated protein 1A [Aphelenchoides avenae]|nr:S-phase kinase-associated protein 1A [Aphelenchus avenae]